jgi:uncharacterized membrane protein YqjE
MTGQSLTYLVAAVLAVLGLGSFCALVVVPAASSYRRSHERLAVTLLSLYLLAVVVGVGAIAGVLIAIEWPRFF